MPNQPPQLSADAVVQFLVYLWAVNRRLKQAFEPQLDAHGLDMRRYLLLMSVGKGTVHPKALSEKLEIPASLMSRYIDQLVQQGCLERQIDPTDSRRIRLLLTEAGQAATQRATQDIKAETSRRLKTIEPDKLLTFLEVMHQLGQMDAEPLPEPI